MRSRRSTVVYHFPVWRERQRERETERNRERDRDRERERQRETETERDREIQRVKLHKCDHEILTSSAGGNSRSSRR